MKLFRTRLTVLAFSAAAAISGLLFDSYGLGAAQEGSYKEVRVKGIFLDPQPVVLLVDLHNERVLPIWIGLYEAIAIESEINGETHRRPLTHDLLASVIKEMEGTIERVVVSDLKEGIYYARLFIRTGQTRHIIDARPSDAIVLALKSKSPIFVEKNLFSRVSHKITRKKEPTEQYGLRTQRLTPVMAESFSFPGKGGILVADVKNGSQAQKDGLMPGDIIVSVNDISVRDQEGFWKAFRDAKGPQRIKIFRGKRYIELLLHKKP